MLLCNLTPLLVLENLPFTASRHIYTTQKFVCVSNECVYKRKQQLFDVVGCAYEDGIIQLCG